MNRYKKYIEEVLFPIKMTGEQGQGLGFKNQRTIPFSIIVSILAGSNMPQNSNHPKFFRRLRLVGINPFANN